MSGPARVFVPICGPQVRLALPWRISGRLSVKIRAGTAAIFKVGKRMLAGFQSAEEWRGDIIEPPIEANELLILISQLDVWSLDTLIQPAWAVAPFSLARQWARLGSEFSLEART